MEELEQLGARESGLTSEEVEARLEKHGYNELVERAKTSPLRRYLDQFMDPMMLMLLVAALISAIIGEKLTAIAITMAVIINSTIGFIQEYKSEKAIEALKRLAAPKAKVIRDGKAMEVPARELVPGDLILLEIGDQVPADARLIESINLKLDESTFTGESAPVSKDAELDEKYRVYMSTSVSDGRGKAIVTGTGMKTEFGKIADMIQRAEEVETPIQRKLEVLAKQIAYIALVIVAIVFFTGVFRQIGTGGSPMVWIFELFLIAVALAVAAIPEGLPTVVTLTLAIGMQRMVRRKVIVRRLPSVESLGSATVICSDKTGTLTQNEMTVQKIYSAERMLDVSGVGYEPNGAFSNEGKVEIARDEKLLLRAAILCNNARLEREEGRWQVIGSRTEGALITLGKKAGMSREIEEESYPRVGELPFESNRKLMSTLHNNPEGGKIAFVKGAPAAIIERSTHAYEGGKVSALGKERKGELLNVNRGMAGSALRVLALAYRELPEDLNDPSPESVEKELTFLGFVGMIDPPREGVKHAIELCKEAGITVTMITGDQRSTAVAIAKELGILDEGRVLTGPELNELGEEGLDEIIEDCRVFARTTPPHKVRILEALKKKGHLVAMTGDGVNDAPALKLADIGVSMGVTGTDVAREASDMILTDDNFASIVNAVEEGRGIYDNIKKFLRFQLSTNVGAIATVFIGTLAGLPLPLTAIQLLWINIIMDGPPALSLGLERADERIMKRPPRDPNEKVLSREISESIGLLGILMCIGTLSIFAYELGRGTEPQRAQTMAFTTFVMFQMFNVFNCRSEGLSIFELGPFTNKAMFLAVAAASIIQVAVIHLPILQPIFQTVALSLYEWVTVIALGSTILVAGEVRKWTRRASLV